MEIFYLFEYNEQGKHSGKKEILSSEIDGVFKTIVVKARDEKRKIIITDAEDYCVFHMENGKIIFPIFSDN